MRLKKFLQNINILNIILIAAVIVFAAYSIFPTLEMKVKYALPAAKNIEGAADEKTGELEIPSLTQYTAVVDENLFHPERRIPPEKKEDQPLPKPEFVLYGTMIADDISLAYLEDLKAPRSTPGRGKRQVALKKGDSMSGFILKEIETEKIVMFRGEERIVVSIHDPGKPKLRETSAPSVQSATRQSTPSASDKAASSKIKSRPPAAQLPSSSQPATTPQIVPSTQQSSTTTQQPTIQPAPQQNIQGTKDMFQKFFRPQR